jgi:hypothetical protein
MQASATAFLMLRARAELLSVRYGPKEVSNMTDSGSATYLVTLC